MGMKDKFKQAIESDHAKDITKGAKDVITTPAAKEVLGAAAAGAVMGSIIPVVGTAIGAQAGAAFGLYKAITKETKND